MSAQRFGFVGLGQMGSRMAANLIRNGLKTSVFDVNLVAIDQLSKLGATVCSSPKDIAKDNDVVITMLPNGDLVKDVYLDSQSGILAGVRPHSLLIDCSTIDPMTPKELLKSAQASQEDVTFVDAPVSGGIGAAEAATLTFLVGGSEAAYAKAKAALGYMGKAVLHCGTNPGAGQAVKLANNLALAIQMAGVSEAMLLGTRLGVDPKVLANALNNATAQCWSSEKYNPYPGIMENVPASRNYEGGFAVDLMLKDLGLATAAADSVNLPVGVGKEIRDLYAKLSAAGYGKLDFGSVLKYLDELPKKS